MVRLPLGALAQGCFAHHRTPEPCLSKCLRYLQAKRTASVFLRRRAAATTHWCSGRHPALPRACSAALPSSPPTWPALGLLGRPLRASRKCLLKLDRGQVSQRRVPPLEVVVTLDVLEDAATGLPAGVVVLVVDQLLLQRGEKTLHRRVVPALPLAAHAALDLVLVQHRLVVRAGVLAATVGVRQQPF